MLSDFNIAVVSIQNSEEKEGRESEVNEPLPGSSQSELLSYNVKLQLNWVFCNGNQQAVFMVGSSTFHMSSVWANVEQWSWLGSHENEQKAYCNCGWAKSLLIVMNLA